MAFEQLWEYKESNSKLGASPEEVANVKEEIEYSNHLIKVHDVMKVLDLADDEDNIVRKLLLKQDNSTLEELVKKSKHEVQTFLINEKTKDEALKLKKYEQNKEDLDKKFKSLKLAFPQSILEQNPKIANKLKEFDWEKDYTRKDEILQSIKKILKQPWKLQSITDQLWWAKESNEEYQKFKTNLIAVDSGFKPLFDELEKTKSKETPNADKIAKQIEKESGGMIDIDIKSNTPSSKLNLVGSTYSFNEQIDKNTLDKLTLQNKDKLDEIQSSFATLKGLAKPFDLLASQIGQNLQKDDFKEKAKQAIQSFPKEAFAKTDEMYEKMGIKEDMQIQESDITNLANIDSAEELKEEIAKIREKFEKIQNHIQELQANIETKHQNDVKELLMMDEQAKERQVKVLTFMRNSWFDMIPQQITDRIIKDIKTNKITIPWLQLHRDNIDLKNWNFWEAHRFKGEWLNIESKTNMVKFINKMISGGVNEPLPVDAIANSTSVVDKKLFQTKCLESGVTDLLSGWKYKKVMENLSKWAVDGKRG